MIEDYEWWSVYATSERLDHLLDGTGEVLDKFNARVRYYRSIKLSLVGSRQPHTIYLYLSKAVL